MKLDQNAVRRLLSLNDAQLRALITRLAGENGIDLAGFTQKAATDFFGSGCNLTGILQFKRPLKPGQQEQIRAAIEKRIETQKNTFEGYGVEQFEMLENNAVVEVRGNFILFVVNTDSAEARKAFLKAI